MVLLEEKKIERDTEITLHSSITFYWKSQTPLQMQIQESFQDLWEIDEQYISHLERDETSHRRINLPKAIQKECDRGWNGRPNLLIPSPWREGMQNTFTFCEEFVCHTIWIFLRIQSLTEDHTPVPV